MSIADVLSRVATIEQLAAGSTAAAQPTTSFADALAAADPTATPGATEQLAEETGLADTALPSADGTPTDAPLALLLAQLQPATAPAPTPAASDPTTGQRVLAAAESQVGVSEQPPGSNDGPELAGYRTAVDGAEPGQPWCATFASWAAQQAGEPLGDQGQGFDSVADLTQWAAGSGRLLPASATPQPGDLILFGDRHVGIVESVNPDGTLTTVEGNYANAVSRVTRSPSEATGYVQL